MKKFISLSLVLVASPFIASATDAFSLLNTLSSFLAKAIPVLITVAVIYFIWSVIQYTLTSDEESKKKAKGGIIQGLIGLFVILSFWGIIQVVENTLQVGPQPLNSHSLPCVPNPAINLNC